MRPTLLALALVSGAAAAGPCIKNDAWTGPDKVKHFAGGAAIAAAVTLATKRPEYGVIAATAVAAAKEARDRRSPNHTCSLQDFAVTVAGAAAGAYGSAWLLLPQRGGLAVAYAKAF